MVVGAQPAGATEAASGAHAPPGTACPQVSDLPRANIEFGALPCDMTGLIAALEADIKEEE